MPDYSLDPDTDNDPGDKWTEFDPNYSPYSFYTSETDLAPTGCLYCIDGEEPGHVHGRPDR